ncbi:FAR1 DNA binding domain, Zinc finger, SWIM-type, MULE transposase domain, FHY3/FAR1 family [Artemisia annua]|uniref:FAR1 DNA binding domain, Zinc finger, SWIM-type, MULE transposase domain, FHY3/FAR1 family n=1 Tax=Artemisia annua TaxID=35608 RepID=A0A2U1M517_ARTAN|nr:FAR1 DNA binding domain, Zinc finger, SWIM-type, MULE transposase domain, FHY3/FAR1 family [Artemisia annua]
MSNSTNNDSMEDVPSTPRSTHNVQTNVVDADVVPQAGSYQPTPPGKYAREGGFEVRRGGQSNRKKNPDLKYFCCSKEGVKQPKKDKPKTDTSSSDIAEVVKVIKRRKRASQRCGCKALLRLRKTPCGNKYVVYTFFEKHNHSLVHENDYKYLRAARKLTFTKQQLLRQLSEANIGPTRAWKPSVGSTEVGPDLSGDDDFKQRLCDIVWTDKIDPHVFESEWESIMNDFNLNDNKWLNDMFGMRTKWIPAYFRHEPMSGLMRTTSRSEFENHFLGQITNPYLSLVEFLSHYDTAIDSQRYIYGKNTHNSNYTSPDLKTHLVIEKEAAEFYTHTIFYDVQDEIFSSLMHCCSLSIQESDSCSIFLIRDTEADYRIKGTWVQAKYEVTYVRDPCSAKCTCLRVFHFPKQYMDNRWSKHAMSQKSVDANKASPSSTNLLDATVREIYSNVEESLHHLVGDIEKLHIYRDDQTSLMEKAKLDVPKPPMLNTNEDYARTLGVTEPAELTIFTPTGINNKGHVIRTRRKSKTEIAVELSNKPMRKCKSCGKLARHDSRNCPKKKKGLQDEDVDQSMMIIWISMIVTSLCIRCYLFQSL